MNNIKYLLILCLLSSCNELQISDETSETSIVGEQTESIKSESYRERSYWSDELVVSIVGDSIRRVDHFKIAGMHYAQFQRRVDGGLDVVNITKDSLEVIKLIRGLESN